MLLLVCAAAHAGGWPKAPVEAVKRAAVVASTGAEKAPGTDAAKTEKGAVETAPGEAAKGAAEDPTVLESIQQEIDDILARFNLEFYGHFKLDMARDSAKTNFGDTAFFVKNYARGEQDEEINIHARHTRVGLNWKGPEYEGIKAFGKIEMDFPEAEEGDDERAG